MNFISECDVKVEPNFYEYEQVVACSSQNYIVLDKTCFCCRNTNVPLVKLSSCSHNGFLLVYFMRKINLAKTMVCQYCHTILRNIQKFKKQVEQSIINSKQASSKIIRKLLKTHTVLISIDPEDVKPIVDNMIFIPETIIKNNFDVKDEFVSDESTRSAFGDFNEEESPLGDDIEGNIPVWRLDAAEMQTKKLLEERLEPNTNHFQDHSYARSNIKDKTSFTKSALQKAKNVKDKVSFTKSALENATKTVREIQMDLKTPIQMQEKLTKPGKRRRRAKSILMRKKQRQPRAIRQYVPRVKKAPRPQSLFQCEICSATFDVEATHEYHMKAHEKMQYGRNDLNDKINILYLNREEMEVEREKRRHNEYAKFEYKCEYCLSSFFLEDGLQYHMKKHDTSKSEYVCDVCKCVYTSEAGLTKHAEYHWKRYQCMECGEKFVHDVQCISHYNKIHGKESKRINDYYSCRYIDCDYVANDYPSYRRHLRQAHSQRLNCDICGNLFKSAGSLKQHLQTSHEPRRIYECKQCDKQYKSRGSLILHMRAHRTEDNEVAYCKECDKQFKDQNRLNVHLRTHSRHITEEQKKFICDICGMRFLDKVRIRSHIEITHLRAAFQCTHCDKVLSCSRSLRKHELIEHSDNPRSPPVPKLCQICGRGFKHEKSLEEHVKSHTGERPLKCTRCPATFSRKASLYTHNRLVHKVPKKQKPAIHTHISHNSENIVTK